MTVTHEGWKRGSSRGLGLVGALAGRGSVGVRGFPSQTATSCRTTLDDSHLLTSLTVHHYIVAARGPRPGERSSTMLRDLGRLTGLASPSCGRANFPFPSLPVRSRRSASCLAGEESKSWQQQVTKAAAHCGGRVAGRACFHKTWLPADSAVQHATRPRPSETPTKRRRRSAVGVVGPTPRRDEGDDRGHPPRPVATGATPCVTPPRPRSQTHPPRGASSAAATSNRHHRHHRHHQHYRLHPAAGAPLAGSPTGFPWCCRPPPRASSPPLRHHQPSTGWQRM